MQQLLSKSQTPTFYHSAALPSLSPDGPHERPNTAVTSVRIVYSRHKYSRHKRPYRVQPVISTAVIGSISHTAVILSEAKNLCISLQDACAKPRFKILPPYLENHPCPPPTNSYDSLRRRVSLSRHRQPPLNQQEISPAGRVPVPGELSIACSSQACQALIAPKQHKMRKIEMPIRFTSSAKIRTRKRKKAKGPEASRAFAFQIKTLATMYKAKSFITKSLHQITGGGTLLQNDALVEDLLDLVEDATRGRGVLHLHGLAKLAQKLLLVLVQLARRLHPDLDDQVALASLVQMRNSLAA